MTLVFDFDGTLHRTDAIYGYAVRKVLRELPFSLPAEKYEVSDEALARYLGVNAREMWADFLPSLPADTVESVIARVGDYMREGILAGKTRLYDGIPSLLSSLKEQGHTLVILSNCTCAYMEAQRKTHDLDRWFCAYYCSEAYSDAPKDVIFHEIKSSFTGPFVMIGDRRSDICVAVAHQIRSVGCAYGYGAPGELDEADVVVNAVAELAGAMEGVRGT